MTLKKVFQEEEMQSMRFNKAPFKYKAKYQQGLRNAQNVSALFSFKTNLGYIRAFK